MRLGNAAILLAGLAIAVSAYGDEIVSGTVSNQDQTGNVCSSSSSSASSISLLCGSGSTTVGQAHLNASVTPLSASMQVNLSSFENATQPGVTTIEEASLSFMIDGTYVLAGGTGYGTITWTSDSYRYGEGGGGLFGPCSITIDGVTDSCDLNAGIPLSGTIIVPYNTPVSLLFNASYSAGAVDSDGVYAGMNFNIDPMTPVETPEPPTWIFLGLAAATVYFLHRRSAGASR